VKNPAPPTIPAVITASALVLLAGGFLYGISVMPQETPDKMNLIAAGQIPVFDGGRAKPLDTAARLNLQRIAHKQEIYDSKTKTTHSATEWALDCMTQGLAQFYLKAPIAVADPAARAWFGLPADAEVFQLEELLDAVQKKMPELNELIRKGEQRNRVQEMALRLAAEVETRQLVIERTIEKLKNNESLADAPIYRIENLDLLNLLELKHREGFRYSIREIHKPKSFEKLSKAVDHARDLTAKSRTPFDNVVLEFGHNVMTSLQLMSLDGLYAVPPADPTDSKQQWSTLRDAFITGDVSPSSLAWMQILRTYALGNAKGFNKAVQEYRDSLTKEIPVASSKTESEVWFNNFAPFYYLMYLYVPAFLLVCFSWVFLHRPLHWSAYALLALAFVVHTAALIFRMYLNDRPPVTNLYSSAIFIGWFAIGLCLVVELIFPWGFCLAVGSIVGFLTLLVAHGLSLSGDTMEPLAAVLDTNFWLATHVVCVTMGYAATYVAGIVALAFVLFGVISSVADWHGAKSHLMTREAVKVLGTILYGVICFATLLSFTGTVLGGIWADQSWGRFWGWDPKENGAVLIVIMNAMILHARWAGMVKERGMALMAIVGNMVTTWSWFGTNQLGVGLHSYGFSNTLALACTSVWVVNLVVLGLGMAPLSAWQKGYFDAPPVSPEPGRRAGVAHGH
jgi:ABC-type transport system involved in cytochrome c biogenesis permease subunit